MEPTTDSIYTFMINPQLPRPVQVYINKGHTTVEWSDGVRTTVGIHNERFDIEKGIAMAIVKRLMPRAEFVRLMENGQYQNQNFYYVATRWEDEM